MSLDNRPVEHFLPAIYSSLMENRAFRDRVRDAMQEQNVTKADLARRSGVPYHAIDKFLKRDTASTSADKAVAIARALGIKVDGETEYEELRALFYNLTEEQRRFVLASIRGLLSRDPG